MQNVTEWDLLKVRAIAEAHWEAHLRGNARRRTLAGLTAAAIAILIGGLGLLVQF